MGLREKSSAGHGLLLLWLLVDVGCATNAPTAMPPPAASSPERSSTSAQPNSPTLPCAPGKIAFSREASCNNDGEVEVCLDEASTQRQILEQRMGVLNCSRSRGRAECDTTRQINCRMAVDRSQCIDHTLSDHDWQRVCQLTQFAFVERVVATFYE